MAKDSNTQPQYVINDFMGDTGGDDDTGDQDLDFGNDVGDGEEDSTPDVSPAPAGTPPDKAKPPAPEDDSKEEVEADDGGDDKGEVEDDAEEQSDEKPAKATKARRDEPRIPKSRFDEINNKYKAEREAKEALLAEREAKSAATEGTFDFDAKEQAYMEAVVDGKFDEAKKIRAEIRAAETAEYEAKAKAFADQAGKRSVSETQVQLDFKAAVSELESQYPLLNPEVEGHNEAAIEEVVELRDVYIARGMTPANALRKAVKLVATDYGIEAAGEAAPAPEPTKPAISDKPTDPKTVKQKVAAAKAQPPSSSVGKGAASEEPIDIFSMSEDEFDKLPDRVLAKMRGDLG